MITKVALTAWKRAFPFLSKDARGRIIDTVRKPISEYNAGIQRGNDAIAKKLGVTVIDSKANPAIAEALDSKMHFLKTDPNGAHFRSGGVILQDTIDDAAAKFGRDSAQVAALKDEVKKLGLKENSPMVYVNDAVDLTAGVNSDFIKNRLLRHELMETKDIGRYFTRAADGDGYYLKKGIIPSKPMLINEEGRDIYSHNTLNVLRDELKHVLNSGYTDYHRQFGGALMERAHTGELQALKALGNRDGGALLAVRGATGNFLNGPTKKAQKKFFKNLTKTQKKYDLTRAETSELPSEYRPRYVLADNYGYSDATPVLKDLAAGTRTHVLENMVRDEPYKVGRLADLFKKLMGKQNA